MTVRALHHAFLAMVVVLVSTQASAYSLKDHRQLTEAALAAIQPCLPEPIEAGEIQALVSANLWEDKNLIEKWFLYSHFYQPRTHLQMVRASSRARVEYIQNRLERAGLSSQQKIHFVGSLLHHLQDMTVPMHVLPVNHFWTDGFEKLPVTVQAELQFGSCAELLEQAFQTDALALHQQTAEETLDEVLNGSLSAISLDRTEIPLTWFWEEGNNGEFGSYGVLGNRFGTNWLSLPGRTFRVETSEYQRYKFRRLKSALRVSQLILVKSWLLGNLGATH